MGRFSDLTMRYPDRFLTIVGGAGGFILGMANLNLTGALAAAFLGGLFTLLIANLQPVDPALGPHQ